MRCNLNYILVISYLVVHNHYLKHTYTFLFVFPQNFHRKKNEKNSVFHKHMIEWHDSIPQDINIDILAMCPGDAMLRQVTEAVSINELNHSHKRDP